MRLTVARTILIGRILQARCRRGRDPVPAVPAERRDDLGCGQQEVRHELQRSRRILQPAEGGRIRDEWQQGRRARPQHDRAAQVGGFGEEERRPTMEMNRLETEIF